MITRVKVTTIYNCSLERAFKTPMLCDVTKVHTGFGIMPKVTHTLDHENWGKPGYSKRIFTGKSWLQKAGESSTDKVIERRENEYWKIEVGNFKQPMLGIQKFVGEWKTSDLDAGEILIEYIYTIHSKFVLLYPVVWLFTKTFWRVYMKRVIINIEGMIANNEPYQFP